MAGARAQAVCAALVRRARSGASAYLDVSMFECLVAADDITYGALLNGAPVERKPRPGMLVHRIGEGHVAMQTAGAPHLWARLTTLMGRPELARTALRDARGAGLTGPRCSARCARRWPRSTASTRQCKRFQPHACLACRCSRRKRW
jgi:crotonobetainyl-CoA:carnitine CoA-transferase CaiB-like acyl-CoA transferase